MKNKYIKFFLIIIILSFICSYVVSMSGYYEYTLRDKTLITNQKIQEFEEAIRNDMNVDELNFFNEDEVNYTNRFSNIIYNISDRGNYFLKKILKGFFKKINSVMLEE